MEDYLNEFDAQEEFWNIQEQLQPVFKKQSPWAIEHYLSKGLTEEEGYKKIAERRRNIKKCATSPYQIEHWINKGFDNVQAQVKLEEYKTATAKNPTPESYRKKYGEKLGAEKFNKYSSNIHSKYKATLNNLLNRGYSKHESKVLRSLSKAGIRRTPINVWNSFKDYRKAIVYITKFTMMSIGEDVFSKDDIENPLLHLDHQFSCYGGWVNKISPFIISSIYNLRFLPLQENSAKGQYCSISKEELIELYNSNPLNELREDSEVWKLIHEFINE